MSVCCRSDKDLVNQERSLAMFRDDSKSAGSRNREVGHTHRTVNTSTHPHAFRYIQYVVFSLSELFMSAE